jgi:hypothetical protein
MHSITLESSRTGGSADETDEGASPQDLCLTIATALSGTPVPYLGGSLDSRQIWTLVDFRDSFVPAEHRVPDGQDDGRHDGAGMMHPTPGHS